MLNNEELIRYSRNILLPEIGNEGQLKLKRSSVLVIGAGGLGCSVLNYLTAAGIGTIGVVDFDSVDPSNLQRQILFTVDDVGKPKVNCAIDKLSKLNPFVKFVAYYEQITNKNDIGIITNYDVVIDGTDNFVTRYLVNDACVLLGKPLVYGSVYKFEGQISVFNYSANGTERGPNYRCLFPAPPTPEKTHTCSETGVLGILPGLIGLFQANEAIKICVGIGNVLSGQLTIINSLTMQFYSIKYEKTASISSPSNINEYEKFDYGLFCDGSTARNTKEITSDQLFQLIQNNRKGIQILDVRAYNEEPSLDVLKELQIPFSELIDNADKISSERTVVVICKIGIRSGIAIQMLQQNFGLTNLVNLKGGLTEWVKSYNL